MSSGENCVKISRQIACLCGVRMASYGVCMVAVRVCSVCVSRCVFYILCVGLLCGMSVYYVVCLVKLMYQESTIMSKLVIFSDLVLFL